MNKMEFDKALSNFLDDTQCEAVSEALFGLVRSAFAAGWRAAMGSDLKELMDEDG